VNAGFSNLTTLKQTLLAKTISSDTRFDDFIAAIGLGIFGQIERYCNRKFMWQVGSQEEFQADRSSFVLERFPVVAPITLVEYKQDEQTGWVVQPQNTSAANLIAPAPLIIRSLDTKNGIIYFPDDDDCGEYYSAMRFTYTGGYFWEQLEPDDAAHPSAVPAGASLLPDSVRLAWLLQCKHVWKNQDKTGVDLLKSGDVRSLRFPEDWAPSVEKILDDHVRMAWT